MDILKTNDGFLWLNVTHMAIDVWHSTNFELFAIYDDGSDHLINNTNELKEAVLNNCIIAIGLDYINNIKELN